MGRFKRCPIRRCRDDMTRSSVRCSAKYRVRNSVIQQRRHGRWSTRKTRSSVDGGHQVSARIADVSPKAVERFITGAPVAGRLNPRTSSPSTTLGGRRALLHRHGLESVVGVEPRQRKDASLRRACKIVHDCCSALQAAHHAGLVHRDHQAGTTSVFADGRDQAGRLRSWSKTFTTTMDR